MRTCRQAVGRLSGSRDVAVKAVKIVLCALAGAVLGAPFGYLLVYHTARWDHWNRYHDTTEFWGDIAAVIAGVPGGALLGVGVGIAVGWWRFGRAR